jgi:hypothetical protein
MMTQPVPKAIKMADVTNKLASLFMTFSKMGMFARSIAPMRARRNGRKVDFQGISLMSG